ncbi:aminoglycoside phosphotransferase family protein [Dactylosporangium sp. AC04546]|uniref:aminoglycoside phosphotransferase family protein n=1 Tax=Dactylosporangium sp. AC04546 TaxID=2862460 RepID=UPI001EDCA300|nr:aminoglycoside phosphotransferase family protein [Dactylosporangium sp. AC04546]WVK79106.1 aminoglycoside phosphotransferase family protein [Dactylosporangium sp. AC04546]
MTGEEVLQDDPHRRVVRIGDTVRRPLHPWSPTIHELLQHLERAGFPHSPRLLGIDADGREVLSFIDGESGGTAWARVAGDAGLVAMARLLRDYHDAVRGFRPAATAGWAAADGTFGAGDLVCHGDFGPWNLVWRGDRPVGILDWDYAWPARPLHDVAYALEYVAPFRDDAVCLASLRHPRPPDRRRRLERFAEAYGLTTTDGLVDEVIAQQEAVLLRARRLAAQARQPQLFWQETGALDRVAQRIAWSRAHRQLFDP